MNKIWLEKDEISQKQNEKNVGKGKNSGRKIRAQLRHARGFGSTKGIKKVVDIKMKRWLQKKKLKGDKVIGVRIGKAFENASKRPYGGKELS